MKPRFPVYRQFDAADCGPTCLRMVARYYGRDLRADRVRELCALSRDGISIMAIGRAAEKIGLRSLPAELPFESLRDEAPLPAIVHWERTHFVVVHEIAGDTVRLVDPAWGHAELKADEFRRRWTASDDPAAEGIALLLEPTPAFLAEKDADERPSTRYFAVFREMADHLARYRRYGLQVAAGVLAASVIQLLLPFLTQALVDQGIVGQNLHIVWVILLAQLALVAGRTVGEVIRARLLLHIGARVSMAMRSTFVRKLTRLPMSFFATKLTGDIDRRLNDNYEVQRLLTQTLTPAIAAALDLVIFGIVLAWYSPLILGIFLAGSVLYVLWTVSFLGRVRALVYQRLKLEAAMHDLIQQIVQGIEDLKVYCAQQLATWKWERSQAQLFVVNLGELGAEQAQTLGGGVINELKNIAITLTAATLVINGTLTLGMMLAVQYIVGQLNAPIVQLQNMIRGTDRTRVALERMEELYRTKEEGEAAATASSPSSPVEPAGDIVLSGISFRYGDEHHPEVLADIDLSIPEGRITAIVGVSGSGKTTLVRLLLQLYQPTAGTITVGGQALRGIPPDVWRNRCGAVLQDGYVFADTVANNIALGHSPIDRERLVHAARVANLRDFVDIHPFGYNQMLAGGGEGLSGGQRQRLLIARAVYGAPAYLFFDEATNSLDAENERVIVEGLQAFFAGRTVVIVAHRLSTVRNADQIVVLERGRIVEVGRHQDLTRAQGPYYRLVKNQLELGS